MFKSTPVIKKSYSLKFDELDFDQEKADLRKLKFKERNSLDNLSNSIIDELNESNYSNKNTFKSLKSPFKIYQENKITNINNNNNNNGLKKSVEIQCDLDDEFTLKDSDLTEEELEIKQKNPNNYWKIIAEKLRVELYDNLQENMELHKLKEELKDEHQELLDERDRLMKLIGEADDLFNEIQRTSTNNDSGIQ